MAFSIDSYRDRIEALCHQFGVQKLELFGSATRDDFDPTRSDVDLLVVFGDWGSRGPLAQYMDFKFALEDLFGRSVDLVETSGITNPYFIAHIATQRRLIYAA